MKFVGQLLAQHLHRYPHLQLPDIYKLLHQAAMGPGHALSDRTAARVRLKEEAADLGTGPDDTLADTISPDGKLARIHLRPYLQAGHNLDRLADAFVETAQTFRGDPDKLVKFCACLGDLAAADGIPFAREEVVRYFESIAAQGYPVVHHSQTYRDEYRPSYRVVALDALPALHRS
jgi:hypothetical protein